MFSGAVGLIILGWAIVAAYVAVIVYEDDYWLTFVRIAPSAPVVWLVIGLVNLSDYVSIRRERREEQLDADYREVLRLIEWRPREVTPVQAIEEELSLPEEVL